MTATVFAACANVSRVYAQSTPPGTDSARKIERVVIKADRDRKSAITEMTLLVSASITSEKVEATVHVVDTEDAVKYLPSLFCASVTTAIRGRPWQHDRGA